MIQILFYMCVAALLVIAGVWVGEHFERTRRVVEFESVTELMQGTIKDLRHQQAGWIEAAGKWRDLYAREVERSMFAPAAVAMGATTPTTRKHVAPETSEIPHESFDDPPTVGAADRRVVETRRKEETLRRNPHADLEPVPLMGQRDMAPPPRLREREEA